MAADASIILPAAKRDSTLSINDQLIYFQNARAANVLPHLSFQLTKAHGCRMKRRLIDFGNYPVYLIVRVFICLLQAVRIETCHRFALAGVA